MVRRVATLRMLCFIVLNITTMSVPENNDGCLKLYIRVSCDVKLDNLRRLHKVLCDVITLLPFMRL
jgi:hypothetical protein